MNKTNLNSADDDQKLIEDREYLEIEDKGATAAEKAAAAAKATAKKATEKVADTAKVVDDEYVEPVRKKNWSGWWVAALFALVAIGCGIYFATRDAHKSEIRTAQFGKFGDKHASFDAVKGKVASIFVTEKGAKGIKPGKKFACASDGLISKEAANGQVVDYLYYFGNAQSAVGDNVTLNEIAKAAKDKNADITITAYASPTGSPAYNARLCKQRAKNLENYLEAQGVAPEHIKIIPGGQTSKFGSDAYNRRADIVVNYGG